MPVLIKIILIIIYYVMIGAVVVTSDLLCFHEEYIEQLHDMLNKLDNDMYNTIENSDMAAFELSMRMCLNEVMIWPLVLIARILDAYLKGDDDE